MTQYANIFLVGMGYHAGALPLPMSAIEEAITLNGVAVDTNLQAFRRGRQYVVVPPSCSPPLTRHSRLEPASRTTWTG